MAIISADLQFKRAGHGLLDATAYQNTYSEALAWAKNKNSNAAVGQYIYIANDEVVDDKTYTKGPYIVDVIGENAVLTPLSKGLAGETNLTDKVADLNIKVGQLETDLAGVATDAEDALAAIGTKGADGKASTGLYAEIDAVAAAIDGIEVPVTDVQVDGVTVVGEGGVANINMATILTPYAKSDDVADTYATKTSLDDYALSADVYTKGDADSAISTAISNLNVDGVATAGKYVSDVKQVAGKIEVSLTDLPTVEVPEYSIRKEANAEAGFAATYVLTKDGDATGAAINIPKDMMVESGSVVTIADGEIDGLAAGTYIKLVLANSSDNNTIYIPATSLVDTYKSGSEDYITVGGYTITFNYDAVVADLKNSLADTFDAKGTAESAVADAVAAIDIKLGDYAKTADVNKTLEDYVTSDSLTITLGDYAKSTDVSASIKLVSDKNDAQDKRLTDLEDMITGGQGGGGADPEDQTLVQKVNANKLAITALETLVGSEAKGDDPATGLVATTIDLDSRVDALETNSISSIKLGNNTVDVSDGVAQITLVTDLSTIDASNVSLIAAGTVKSAVEDLTIAVNSKASISLVDAVPGEGDSNVIYLEKSSDNKITEKVYLSNGSYHILGSDLYASKDLASATNAGLMSSDHFTKLDSITSISDTELDGIINA